MTPGTLSRLIPIASFLVSLRLRLDFYDSILSSMVLHRADGFNHAAADALVQDQSRRCVIGHGGVLQAFPTAATEAIDLARERPSRPIVENKRAVVAADGTQTCSRRRLNPLGGTENRNFVKGVFRDRASREVEQGIVRNITAAVLHHDFAFVTGTEVVTEISGFQHRYVLQRHVAYAQQLKTTAHPFDGRVDHRDVLVAAIGADSVFGQRNHLVARDGSLATVHDVEVVLGGPTDFLIVNIIGWAQGAGEIAPFNQDTVDFVKMDAVAERLHVDLTADESGIVGAVNRHEGVLVEAAEVGTAFTVVIGISVGNGALDNKSAVQECVVVVANLEFVFGDPVLGVRLVDDIPEVPALEGVVGPVDVPCIGDVCPAGELALDGDRGLEHNAAQVEVVVRAVDGEDVLLSVLRQFPILVRFCTRDGDHHGRIDFLSAVDARLHTDFLIVFFYRCPKPVQRLDQRKPFANLERFPNWSRDRGRLRDHLHRRIL